MASQTPASERHPERESARAWVALAGAHLAPVLFLFSGLLLGRRVLYFRDLSSHYAPDYEFLHRSLRAGVWPLWNPLADGGGPCLFTYLPDLLLAWLGGHRLALAVGPPLHLWLGMLGASLLGRRLGRSLAGAWLVGAAYGLGGFGLSCVNLVQLFQAWAWAPLVLVAFLRLIEAPSSRRVGLLALVAALQLSTLAAEISLQTAIAGIFLLPLGRLVRERRSWARLLAAGILAVLMAMPVVCGLQTLLEGSARARGFAPAEALSYSASPAVLAEAVFPRFFGDVHAFADTGFWGQPFFPQGYPYLLSLYLGPVVILLAVGAPRGRLHLLALLGLGLALGGHGPLKLLLASGHFPFRFPIKFFLLVALAVCLLAGEGLDRWCEMPLRGRRWLGLLVPGALLVGAAVLLQIAPEASASALGRIVPEILADRAEPVRRVLWPAALLSTGVLTLAAGLALGRGGRWAPLAGLAAVLDLLTVNAGLNPQTQPSFYVLRPEIRALVDQAVHEGPFRWFSYGVANSPGLDWEPGVALRGSDVWLYYMDRQTLLPRTQVFEGLEGIFDADRTGWAPAGGTLPAAEISPPRFADIHERLRRANVRWVVAFGELPAELVAVRGEARLPEIREPVRLYELRHPLPRAFWVPRAEVRPTGHAPGSKMGDPLFDPLSTALVEQPVADCATGEGPAEPDVRYESPDAHTVKLRAMTPPGYLIVLDFHHRYWRARSAEGPVPLVRADGRYWALPVCGGTHELTVTYAPAWVRPALLSTLLGLVIAVTLAARPGRQNLTALGPAR